MPDRRGLEVDSMTTANRTKQMIENAQGMADFQGYRTRTSPGLGRFLHNQRQ
jgi:hypothetical protein